MTCSHLTEYQFSAFNGSNPNLAAVSLNSCLRFCLDCQYRPILRMNKRTKEQKNKKNKKNKKRGEEMEMIPGTILNFWPSIVTSGNEC